MEKHCERCNKVVGQFALINYINKMICIDCFLQKILKK